ncbi:GNAT family N-acetyltransferase [Mechercharimyces sp. CAU 1602]|uniref:GNAT family N-acetyltransferase n=1 Tax=Mechercharimyces sp. CAU 1602 TaxID=2973933 RepID=UPI002161E5FA|nr:GNAT family N-acetyltransferase [Mechercharimyces sp. CAU 1602]MCS1352740.1 acetyltransferase [Mechercharimyces sp. CAU 1602]
MKKQRPSFYRNEEEHRVWEESRQQWLSFRPVEMERDFVRLHQWMHESHVIPFWRLNIAAEKYREYLRKSLSDPHHELHVGMIDGEPMSYWETYWAEDDTVGTRYEAHPEDQGVHLLIGPPAYLGQGYAAIMLRAITAQLFTYEGTEKVVAEPDIRNDKMIHIFKKCGYEFQREIDLPDKRAALLYCTRETLERSYT